MSRLSGDELRAWVWNGYDYDLQAWVMDGLVAPCGHPPWARQDGSACCARARWAGQPITGLLGARPITLRPPEPCPACTPIDRLVPARRALAEGLRRLLPAATAAPCWLCHGWGAIAPAALG
jgi:hypothetical protein